MRTDNQSTSEMPIWITKIDDADPHPHHLLGQGKILRLLRATERIWQQDSRVA